jgi:hypothetical protein
LDRAAESSPAMTCQGSVHVPETPANTNGQHVANLQSSASPGAWETPAAPGTHEQQPPLARQQGFAEPTPLPERTPAVSRKPSKQGRKVGPHISFWPVSSRVLCWCVCTNGDFHKLPSNCKFCLKCTYLRSACMPIVINPRNSPGSRQEQETLLASSKLKLLVSAHIRHSTQKVWDFTFPYFSDLELLGMPIQ